ncbi:MAG: sugar transferase [Pseudomonadota bacterium]
MTLSKRVLDLVIIAVLLPLILPAAVLIGLAIWVTDGRPVIFKQERMKTPTEGFMLWKFRTMRHDPADAGVAGGDKVARITRLGRILRRTHLDELPQLVNLLRGDVSLVGPRPPLRSYVEQYPDLYRKVLKSRPGLTGLASLFFSRYEAMLLSRCATAEETDAVYVRRCVPRKAHLDLLYQKHQSIRLDLWLFWRTVARVLHLPGGRVPKVRDKRTR